MASTISPHPEERPPGRVSKDATRIPETLSRSGDTVATALRLVTAQFAAAAIDEPRREARLLVAAALGVDLATVIAHPERALTAPEAARLGELARRRAAHEPAARLLGRREFWSLDFALVAETLVPRPDSETLIDAVLARLPARETAVRILDLGTGTGCLLLALLKEYPNALGVGVDLSVGAAVTAQANARALGLADRAAFVVGWWGAALAGEFDVIVANPPYVESAAIAGLAPEVALHEPRLALDGGSDGLEAYRALAPASFRLAKPGGVVAVEVGQGQAMPVAALFEAAGLAVSETRADLAGIPRCIVASRPAGAAKKTIGMGDVPV